MEHIYLGIFFLVRFNLECSAETACELGEFHPSWLHNKKNVQSELTYMDPGTLLLEDTFGPQNHEKWRF